MSKNLTRKGLALGAVVALGASLFAGAPAFAGVDSTGVTLAPNAGTTYSTIAGTKFDLANTALSGALQAQYGSSSAANLSFLVTNSGAAHLKFGFDGANGSSTATYDAWTATSASAVTGSKANTADATDLSAKAIVITGASADQGVNTSVAGKKNHLFITSDAAATANVSVDVQAFVDENGNGKIDASDLVSPVRTVTFVPVANITATTTITSAVIGSSVLQASVVLGNDINSANLPAGSVVVQFKKNGTVFNVGGAASTSADWNTDDSVLENAATTASAQLDASTFVAQAYAGSVADANKLGTASNASVPANGTVTSVDSVDSVAVTASANSLTDGTVRAGYTGNVTFTSKIKNASGTAVAAAGVKVKVSVSGTLDSASTFVAGGKTLTATSGAVSFETTTDANGKISFTGAGTGKAADTVTVTVSALKSAGGYTATQSKTITYTTAAATSFVATNLVGNNAVVKTTLGGTYNLSYTVADQFGQAVPTGTYRATLSTSNAATNASITYLATGVAGKIAQAVVDNSTVAGTYDVTATLYTQNTTTLAWASVLSTVVTHVYVNSAAAATVSGTASASTAQATISSALVSADLRVDANTNNIAAIGYGTHSSATQTISGVVTDANGAAVSGAVVTITGAGLGFVVNENVFTVGSATVNTDSNGAYSVDVYSNTAGKTSVVVTSGAATKSVAIEFSGITAMAETNVLSLDVASLSQVGRSVTVTVKLVDKFGNAVDTADGAIAVSVTGVGSLSAATVGTGTAGTATVQFVAGANDFGDAVITAKYTATDAAATVVSATKTLTVGVTDAQVDIVGNRVTAVASFSKGKTVAFYVDGIKKWSKASTSDADVVINSNLKKGTHTVTVKISGGFITTEKFIVK